ncbi:MAG: ABC transporter ATP-binding protein [Chloroflexota bacterium]|nr:ABC transporter ATP-binding protein [Chloroflexota bacterium]
MATANNHDSQPDSAQLAIDVRGLGKSYGRTPVLRDLNLQVPWGQTLTVLGPNGSGKTTLIKTLAMLAKPDAGEVRIAGLSTRRDGVRVRRVIGVVTHEPLLYDGLTGAENLRFFAKMFALDRIDQRIHTVAVQMGVVERLDARIGTLSHGMRRRFSIARALLHSPRLLIMDEPESGLDQQALGLLEALVTDKSNPTRTILMTTHNLERGIALADRVAILSRGRIAYDGAPDADATKAAYRKQAQSYAQEHNAETREKARDR